MTSPLKIPNPGEDPRDAEYLPAALEEAEISCDTFRVATLDELTSAIEQGGFDMIFTDQAFPGFDGFTVRAIAEERCSKYTGYVHFRDGKRKE